MDITKLAEIQHFIANCSDKEVLRAMHGAIKLRWDRLNKANLPTFYAGDVVKFNSKIGPQTGVVVKVNKVNVKVRVGHVTWTVSPGLLRSAEETKKSA